MRALHYGSVQVVQGAGGAGQTALQPPSIPIKLGDFPSCVADHRSVIHLIHRAVDVEGLPTRGYRLHPFCGRIVLVATVAQNLSRSPFADCGLEGSAGLFKVAQPVPHRLRQRLYERF